MAVTAQTETLFDLTPAGEMVVPHRSEDLVRAPEGLVSIDPDMVGLSIGIGDKVLHLTETYAALNEMSIANRNTAAATSPSARAKIEATHNGAAGQFISEIARSGKDHWRAARLAYGRSLGQTATNSELAIASGWYAFRTSYAGPANRKARDAYRAELRDMAKQEYVYS